MVRVEAPNRPDMVRLTAPFDGDQSAWHSLLNRSKRSVALDLKHPEAVAIVKQLVQQYDIVLEQFRPGVMDRLGVGYAALRAANPRLIYCAINGLRPDRPLSRPGSTRYQSDGTLRRHGAHWARRVVGAASSRYGQFIHGDPPAASGGNPAYADG